METFLNALLLKWDGDAETGANAPTKPQVAMTWASVAFLISALLR